MTLGRALLLTSAFLLSAALPVLTAAAPVPAHPVVKLQLAGDLLAQADGKIVATPVDKAVLKRGDLVRYTIVASNAGGKPAVALSTVGPVPARMEYVAGSASHAPAASVEFSLDGKSFSAQPMVTVNTSRGPVQKPADPEQYVAVRWVNARPLAPKQRVRYTYEVRVK